MNMSGLHQAQLTRALSNKRWLKEQVKDIRVNCQLPNDTENKPQRIGTKLHASR